MRKKSVKSKKEKTIKGEILYFLGVLAIGLMVRTFFLSPNVVSGASMMPTLKDRDRVYSTRVGEIERFDIVIFDPENGDDNYIKRVIGLPGETIRYENDQLYVNETPIEEPFLDEYKEALADGENLTQDFYYGKEGQLYTIPENHYFVIGDNRQNSGDSRILGPIKKDFSMKKMTFRLYPFDSFGKVE